MDRSWSRMIRPAQSIGSGTTASNWHGGKGNLPVGTILALAT
jgi:hypothetical protein